MKSISASGTYESERVNCVAFTVAEIRFGKEEQASNGTPNCVP